MIIRNKETKKLEVFSRTPRRDEMPGNRRARRGYIYTNQQGMLLEKIHGLRQEIKEVFKAEHKAAPEKKQRHLPVHQTRKGKYLTGYYGQLVSLARAI